MSKAVGTYLFFQEALRNPTGVAEDELLDIIERYPYAQVLRYAQIRRSTLLNANDGGFNQARLYAPSATWLYEYAHLPVEIIEEIEAISEEYVLFEEEVIDRSMAVVVAGDEPRKEEVFEDNSLAAQKGLQEDSEVEDKAELEKLVHGAGVAVDYFVFEQKEQSTEGTEEEVGKDASPDEEVHAENISLYNDELMPYSFRWWLHKTRLEHADTYQPFAAPVLARPQRGQFDPQKLDEAILDQQIKENIIHFQDPEAKLSDSAKQQSVEISSERKDAKIIERFIREEPIIHPPSPEQLNTENMARQSAEDNYALVTETLANIYMEQGLYLKGIEVFKKLILKYPEKKSYFATRIQELEKNL